MGDVAHGIAIWVCPHGKLEPNGRACKDEVDKRH